MNQLIRFVLFSLVSFCSVVITAYAANVHGVAFDPSPAPEGKWRCGLSNGDLPGLAAEHMQQPLAAGCTRGDATAYAVIVDLSDSRHVMTAEQMAADAEDQLSSSLKLDSKAFDVVSLAGGATASYSRLVGKGDGFTFVSGHKPMVAISINVPLVFEEEGGAPRQAIAVFRLRSILPATATERKNVIVELDRLLRSWAGTAHPAGGRTISARDFEVARARAGEPVRQGMSTPTSVAPAPAAHSQPEDNHRVERAMTAAALGQSSGDDLAALEDAEKQFNQLALGGLAHSYLEDIRRASHQKREQEILSAVVESANAQAGDVLSRILIAAIETRDPAGLLFAIRTSPKHAWSLRSASVEAQVAVAGAVLKHDLPFVPAAEDHAFFELPSGELLVLLQRTRTIPTLEEIARPDRDRWRILNRRSPSKAAYIVQREKSVGVLEREGATEFYHYRQTTNLLDVAAVEP